jgi:putative transposase
MDHLIEAEGGVSLAGAGEGVEGADVKSIPVSEDGLSAELLEELACWRAGVLACWRPRRPPRAVCG